MTHRAGQQTTLMRTYVKLRNRCPELFGNIFMCQQPQACVDEIPRTWGLLDLKEDGLGQVLSQRDLLCTPFAGSRIAAKLSQTVTSYIVGGMTLVLQVTDTDYAHRAKAGVEEEKQTMNSEIKLEEVARGEVSDSKEDSRLNCDQADDSYKCSSHCNGSFV